MVTYEVFIGALLSLLVVGTGAFYWLMSEIRNLRQDMRQEMQAIRQENRADNQALREEMQTIREENRADNQVLREEMQAIREEHRADNQALREEMRANTQRILEALYFHRHDPDGTAVFYPPTSAAPAD